MRSCLCLFFVVMTSGCAHYGWGTGSDHASVRRDALLHYSMNVLDLLDAGAINHASERIEHMVVRFGSAPPQSFLVELLRRRSRSTNTNASPVVEPRVEEQPADLSAHLTSDPAAAAASYQRAREALADGDGAAARQHLEEACRLDPTHRDSSIELAKYLKEDGLEFYGQGKVDTAIEHWKRALQLVPDDDETAQFLKRARTVREQP